MKTIVEIFIGSFLGSAAAMFLFLYLMGLGLDAGDEEYKRQQDDKKHT